MNMKEMENVSQEESIASTYMTKWDVLWEAGKEKMA